MKMEIVCKFVVRREMRFWLEVEGIPYTLECGLKESHSFHNSEIAKAMSGAENRAPKNESGEIPPTCCTHNRNNSLSDPNWDYKIFD